MEYQEAREYLKDLIRRLKVVIWGRLDTQNGDWTTLPELLSHPTNPERDDDLGHGFQKLMDQGHYSAVAVSLCSLYDTTELVEDEFIAIVELAKNHEELNEIASNITFLRGADFHSDLTDEQLAEIVLFIFSKGSYRYEDYASYIAQLQRDPTKMFRLLGLSDTDLDLFWAEVAHPTLVPTYYTVVVLPVLELLRRKRTLEEMKQ